MIGIFYGRGIAEKARIHAQIDVDFRAHIHLFSNGKNINALGVFLNISLHANDNGWAWPSRELMMTEVGINTQNAMTAALAHLRTLKIDGQRIFAHYRQKDASTHRWGRSAYLIFPDLPHGPPPFGGMLEYNPLTDYPYMGDPLMGEPYMGDPSLKEEPSKVKPSKEISTPVISTPAVLMTDRFDPNTSAGRARIRTVEAMRKGSVSAENIETDLMQHCKISPNLNTKSSREFVAWLKDRPDGQSLQRFAEWWYRSDWRGKNGQPPNLGLIRELWPQAFPVKAQPQSSPFIIQGIIDTFKALRDREPTSDELAEICSKKGIAYEPAMAA